MTKILDEYFKIRENLRNEFYNKLDEINEKIESLTNNTFNYEGKFLKFKNTYIHVQSYNIRCAEINSSYNSTVFDFFGLSFGYEIGLYPESNWCKWDWDGHVSCRLDDIINNNVVEISESEFYNAFNNMLKSIKEKHYSIN